VLSHHVGWESLSTQVTLVPGAVVIGVVVVVVAMLFLSAAGKTCGLVVVSRVLSRVWAACALVGSHLSHNLTQLLERQSGVVLSGHGMRVHCCRRCRCYWHWAIPTL
jgi:hypothetical protein